MKFDLQLHSNEDLEYFKTLFLRNVGVEQISYYFYSDDIEVRLSVSGLNGYEMINIGFFHRCKVGNSVSLTQFCPLTDSRYANFEAIRSFWGYDSSRAWGTSTHSPEEVERAFQQIAEILHIVYKVNNLKAFL